MCAEDGHEVDDNVSSNGILTRALIGIGETTPAYYDRAWRPDRLFVHAGAPLKTMSPCLKRVHSWSDSGRLFRSPSRFVDETADARA